MWSAEYSIETDAPPAEVWRHWADVDAWPEWNRDIERIELHGPLGSAGGS
jgi:hypothetical protein